MIYSYKVRVYVKETLPGPEEFRDLLGKFNGATFSNTSRDNALLGRFQLAILTSKEPIAIEDLRAGFPSLTIDSLTAIA